MEPTTKTHIDQDLIVNKSLFEELKEMVICIICTGVLVEPVHCKLCENAFCKECITTWLKKSSSCPFKCNKLELTEVTRMRKNLLDKLVLKCPFECSEEETFMYENLLKHFKSCVKLKTYCPCCNSFVLNSNIKESNEIIILKDKIFKLEDEILLLKIKNLELENKVRKDRDRPQPIVHVVRNREELIDKCEHFKGNYKPIFTCCSQAYACYICHDEKQNHAFQFSNKVVCLICHDIYSGSQCPHCNTVQAYKKK